MPLSYDILQCILECMDDQDLSPRRLLVLATVNKQFYAYCMADTRWHQFDVYEIGTGIAKHYIKEALDMPPREQWDLIRTDMLLYEPLDEEDSLYTQFNMLRYGALGMPTPDEPDPTWPLYCFVWSKQLLRLLWKFRQDISLHYMALPQIKDREFMHELLRIEPGLFERTIEDPYDVYWRDGGLINDDYEAAKIAVEQNGAMLGFASERLQADRSLVELAAKNLKFGEPLLPIPPLFLTEKSILLNALDPWGGLWTFCSPELRKYPDVLKAVARGDPSILNPSHGFPLTRELLLIGVQKLGFILKDHKTYSNDKEIVVAAVKAHGEALEFAHPTLQNDLEVARAAVANNPQALKFASQIVRQNRELVELAVLREPLTLRWAGIYQDDKDLVKRAVEIDGLALEFASRALKADAQVVRAALEQNPLALEHAAFKLRDNRELVTETVKRDGMALYFASEKLTKDRDVAKAAVAQTGYAVRYTPFTDDREMMMLAVKTTGRALKHAQWTFSGYCLQDDEQLTIAAVQQDGIALASAATVYWDRFDIAMSALKSTPHAFQYVSERLQADPSFQFTAFCLTGERHLMTAETQEKYRDKIDDVDVRKWRSRVKGTLNPRR